MLFGQLSREHKAKTQAYHDSTHRIVSYLQPGTIVMAIDTTREIKWDPIYEGPYEVVRKTHGGSYILRDQTVERRTQFWQKEDINRRTDKALGLVGRYVEKSTSFFN